MASIDSIVDRQLRRWEFQQQMQKGKLPDKKWIRPIITVSRAYGARGEEVARKLAESTGFHLLDREILDCIIDDIGIQNKMVELFDEDTRSELESWFYGMMTGRIVDASDYLKSLTRIIGSIVNYGGSIIVGRGANVIAGEYRAKTISERLGVSIEKATAQIEESDKKKAAYFRKSFGVDINDLSHYDLVISADSYNVDDIVELALLAYGKKEKILRGRV